MGHLRTGPTPTIKHDMDQDLPVLQSNTSESNEEILASDDAHLHSISSDSDFIFEDAVQDIASDNDQTPTINLN